MVIPKSYWEQSCIKAALMSIILLNAQNRKGNDQHDSDDYDGKFEQFAVTLGKNE